MSSKFFFHSDTDPASLAVNKKHLIASRLPADVKKAQDDLVLEMKAQLITYEAMKEVDWLNGDDGSIYEVFMEFGFKSDQSDIDGPVKRVLDALQKALVARGYHWNDRMVYDLRVSKYLSTRPNITVKLERMQ
jgi:Holliday junction resolvase RusA-like endonuclease